MTEDIVVGLGLVLVIEGVLWAAFPDTAMRLMKIAAATPEQTLRTAGVIAAVAGFGLVWLVRG